MENSDEGHFQAVTLPLRGVYVYKFQESTEPTISEFLENFKEIEENPENMNIKSSLDIKLSI